MDQWVLIFGMVPISIGPLLGYPKHCWQYSLLTIPLFETKLSAGKSPDGAISLSSGLELVSALHLTEYFWAQLIYLWLENR